MCIDSEHSAITRFAPSPTGFLHLGHAYSALIAKRQAMQTGGRFLLRIEVFGQVVDVSKNIIG